MNIDNNNTKLFLGGAWQNFKFNLNMLYYTEVCLANLRNLAPIDSEIWAKKEKKKKIS